MNHLHYINHLCYLTRRHVRYFYYTALLVIGLGQTSFAQTTINVQSFGALGTDLLDDTAAINLAIAALPASASTLYFPCGTYLVRSGLRPIQISNVTITGPTTNCVTIKATGTGSFTMLQVGNQAGLGTPVKLAKSSAMGSSTFTVTAGGLSARGIRAGSYVLVQNEEWASQGAGSPLIPSQQVVLVTAVSGDTATIAGTFAQLFTSAACASPPTGECGGSVQRFAPTSGNTITYIKVDGSGNTGRDTVGIQLNLAVNSKLHNVQVSNFVGLGISSGIEIDTGYNNSIQNVSCTRCGNGGSAGADGITIRRQNRIVMSNVTVTQTAAQSVFSLSLRETHFGTLNTVTIDAGGADGRPLKLMRASHNTFNSLTVKNGSRGGHNGISVTDISAYNTFNNCVVLNNSGRGIALFGNDNRNNTFNNCTVKYSTQAQFGQFATTGTNGVSRDYNTTITGGTYCCSRSGGMSANIAVAANYFNMTGVAVSDDQGQAGNGLLLSMSNAVVKNNTFSGFSSGHDIYVKAGLSTHTFCGNKTPSGNTPWIASPNCTSSAQNINVTDYGAKGDDVADDTAAINRAIAALPASGPATLSFPCGTYIVSAPLSPIRMSSLTVTGPTTNCVTIKAVGSGSFAVLNLSGGGLSSAVKLSRNVTSNTFAVTSGGLAARGIRAGSHVLVQRPASGSPPVADQHMVKVTAVSGDTATIEGTFAHQFTVAAGSYIQSIVDRASANTIAHIAFDASQNNGSSTQAIVMNYSASSVIKNVKVSNFVGTGNSGCLMLDTGYNIHISNSTFTRCGNGGDGANDSVVIRRQNRALLQDVTIANTAAQSVSNLSLRQTYFSTLSSVTLDSGGANGNPLRFLHASNNTINSTTAKNAGGGASGVALTGNSSYNNFNNCVVLNNSGYGIFLAGDSNDHNTFTNCTAKYNQQAQLGQYANGDYYTTVTGGTYCCSRRAGGAIISIAADYFTLTGTTISDDNGLAQNGLVMSAINATVENNKFSRLPAGHDIYVKSSLSANTFCENQVPDGTTPQIPYKTCN